MATSAGTSNSSNLGSGWSGERYACEAYTGILERVRRLGNRAGLTAEYASRASVYDDRWNLPRSATSWPLRVLVDRADLRRLCYSAAMQPATTAEELEFRCAIPADVADIVALVESAYRGDASRAGWTTEADLLDGQRTDAEELAGILKDTDSRLLLATRGREIVGCVLLRREAAGAYIGMLAVRPSLQALGIGKRLLAEAEKRARIEFGAERSRMTVIEQRRDLIGWYVRRGYLLTTRIEPFPYDNPRFGLPRRTDLRFVVLEKALA